MKNHIRHQLCTSHIIASRDILDDLTAAWKLQEHAQQHNVVFLPGAIIDSDEFFSISFLITVLLELLHNDFEGDALEFLVTYLFRVAVFLDKKEIKNDTGHIEEVSAEVFIISIALFSRLGLWFALFQHETLATMVFIWLLFRRLRFRELF